MRWPPVFASMFCALAALWTSTSCGQDTAVPKRPNIVILLADDLGYGELGCQGNPQIPTPHIDSIAAAGARFTDGYVTASYCSPSRAGLWTGRYQTRFGHELNPTGRHNANPAAGLPASEITLADHLRGAGYATALVGKWHLGATARSLPIRRGLDEFFGFLGEGHFYVPAPFDGVTTILRRRELPGGGQGRSISPDGRLIYTTHMGHDEPPYDANNPIIRDGQPVEEQAYLTDAFTREAVDFIDRHRQQPFLLFVSYSAVHSPLQGADAYMQRFEHISDVHRRVFAAMLSNLDDSVGAILTKLRDEQLDRRTLVVFLSDNGGPTRELTSSNAPLRGGKGDMYEGGLRVPFLMQWPGVLPPGRVERRLVCSLDIFATAATLANAPVDQKLPSDGVNLIPYLTNEDSGDPHETLYWRMGRKAALRHGDWKMLRNPRGRDDAGWELYDLSQDVSESHNLAASHPDRLAELVAAWQRINAEMVQPRWRRGEVE